MDLESLFQSDKITAALRTQLGQISAASQALERAATSERDYAYLSVINQNICRMLRLVSHMELGQRLLDPEKAEVKNSYMDLSAWASDLSLHLESVLREIGIGFTLCCPDHLFVMGDRELLRHLLMEMVFHVAIAGTDIQLSVAQENGDLLFTVQDQGPGSSAQRTVLPEIVESHEEQTSLELARRITRLHGGALVASADAKLGLTLTASLPKIPIPANSSLESPALPLYGGFHPALISLSPLLPSKAFLPDNLG